MSFWKRFYTKTGKIFIYGSGGISAFLTFFMAFTLPFLAITAHEAVTAETTGSNHLSVFSFSNSPLTYHDFQAAFSYKGLDQNSERENVFMFTNESAPNMALAAPSEKGKIDKRSARNPALPTRLLNCGFALSMVTINRPPRVVSIVLGGFIMASSGTLFPWFPHERVK